MKLELIVNLSLEADHSLEENEAQHSHRWDIEVGLTGEPKQGRILSLPFAHRIFDDVLKPLRNTYLNNNSYLDKDSREFPTCENLASFLMTKFSLSLAGEAPGVRIGSVQVGVWEDTGLLGSARLTQE